MLVLKILVSIEYFFKQSTRKSELSRERVYRLVNFYYKALQGIININKTQKRWKVLDDIDVWNIFLIKNVKNHLTEDFLFPDIWNSNYLYQNKYNYFNHLILKTNFQHAPAKLSYVLIKWMVMNIIRELQKDATI